MRFWLNALLAGIFGVLLTSLGWLVANPDMLDAVGMGQVMMTIAIVGCSFMLLGGLYTRR